MGPVSRDEPLIQWPITYSLVVSISTNVQTRRFACDGHRCNSRKRWLVLVLGVYSIVNYRGNLFLPAASVAICAAIETGVVRLEKKLVLAWPFLIRVSTGPNFNDACLA
jgi:hypothetical protein